jgi:hypothetical protein
MSFIIQKAAQSVAAGIGLASEAHHHHKEKKKAEKEAAKRGDAAKSDETLSPSVSRNSNSSRASSTQSVPTSPGSDKELADHHEAVWELDDAQEDVLEKDEKPLPEGKGIENPMKIASAFIEKYPAPRWNAEENGPQLPLPVVLPQRRPEARARGFIRAYAPLLENSYLDQVTFLEFLHDLNVVCLPNPWIQAINLASFATMALPTVSGMIVSRIINKATQAISEVHSRSK